VGFFTHPNYKSAPSKLFQILLFLLFPKFSEKIGIIVSDSWLHSQKLGNPVGGGVGGAWGWVQAGARGGGAAGGGFLVRKSKIPNRRQYQRVKSFLCAKLNCLIKIQI